MSWNRADSKYPIRRNIVHTPVLQTPKKHGEYAFVHPAAGDPTGGRHPTDLLYEGVNLRAFHGQAGVADDARAHPPIVCAVTSSHTFATGILCTFREQPCLLLPHRACEGAEGGLASDELDVVARVAPPSTTATPSKDDFFLVPVRLEPETLFVHSPRPPPNPPDAAYAACDEDHMDYALIAARLPPELPREWLRSLEESAAFGFAPARGQDALVGQAPKRWLDPVFAKVGKAAVGVNWRKGTITDPRPEPPEREVPAWQRALEEKARAEKAANGGGASAPKGGEFAEKNVHARPPPRGLGFGSSHAGAPSVARSVGGAVLACMAPATAKAAGVRNSMAADARFADAVRPFAAPPAGCGDWGILVGMHRGYDAGDPRAAGDEGRADVVPIVDILADVERRIEAGRGVEANAEGARR